MVRRWGRGVVVTAMAVASLAGCGKVQHDVSSDPTPQGIAAAADTTATARTGRFTGELRMDEERGADPSMSFAASIEGAYDLEAQQSSTVLVLTEATGNDPGLDQVGDRQEMIVDGDAAYIRSTSGGEVETVNGKEWLRDPFLADGGSVDPAFAGLGGSGLPDAAAMLDQLRRVSEQVSDLGTADVGGITTRHYRAEASMASLMEPAGATSTMPANFAGPDLAGIYDGLVIPVDVYVDGDGFVRRVEQHIDYGEAMRRMDEAVELWSAEQGIDPGPWNAAQAGESDTFAVYFRLDFSEFGEPVTITVPAAEQIGDRFRFEEVGEVIEIPEPSELAPSDDVEGPCWSVESIGPADALPGSTIPDGEFDPPTLPESDFPEC